MTVTIETIADTFAKDVKELRSAAVTAENKATPFARSSLASLLAGIRTPDTMTAAILHAFGNPRAIKSGKPVAKVSGLRDFTGGDGVRKAYDSVIKIFDNVDADKPREVTNNDGETVIVGSGKIRALVRSFVLAETDAPKSLRALEMAVRDAMREFAAQEADATGADNADAKAENAKAEAEAKASGAAEPFNAADALAKLALFFAEMSADDVNALDGALNAAMDAWDNRVSALAAPAPLADAV